MSSWTKRRVPDSHICPWWKKVPKSAPSTAMSRSASGQTMFADFPPSSSVTLFVWGGRGEDLAARLCGPGEGDLVHVGVLHVLDARGDAVAGHHVEHTFGQEPGLVDGARDRERAQRRLSGGVV